MAGELTTREMIGAGLQRVRRHLGVAQGYFAAKMRVTPGAVSQWESGAARLPLDRLPQMAQVLGIDTDLLLYEMGLTERVPDPTLEEMIARRIGRERAALWSARVEATAPADILFGSGTTAARSSGTTAGGAA